MRLSPENLRLVLGLKLRSERERRGLTLQRLAAQSGLAVSYLSEIEKGKKYPLDVFHAERRTNASTFRIDTTLEFVNCGAILLPK